MSSVFYGVHEKFVFVLPLAIVVCRDLHSFQNSLTRKALLQLMNLINVRNVGPQQLNNN